ncbi:hypothetical protein TCAL_11879, partial [Tigriopus californicus]
MTTRANDTTGSTCLVIYERRSRSVPTTKKRDRPLAFSAISHPCNDLGDVSNEGHYSTDDHDDSANKILKSHRRRSEEIVHDLVLERFKGRSEMNYFLGQGHAVPYGSNPDSNHLLRDSQGQAPMCVKMSNLGRKVVSFQQDVPNCDTEATVNECLPPSYEILSTTQNSHKADRPSTSDMNSHGTVPRETRRTRQKSVRPQKLPGIAYLMEGEHCPGSYSLGGRPIEAAASSSSSLPTPFPTHEDEDDGPTVALSTPARQKNRDDRSVVGCRSSNGNPRQSPADSHPEPDQVAITSTIQGRMDKTTGSKAALKFAKQTVEVMDLGGSLPDLTIIEDFEKNTSLFAPIKSQTLNRTKREINADARKRWRLAFERIQLAVADGTVDQISNDDIDVNEIRSVEDALMTGDRGCISDSGELSDEAKAKLAKVKWKQVLKRLDEEKSFFRFKKGEASKHWREKSQLVGDRLREKSVAWREKTLRAEHKISDRANEMFKEHHQTHPDSEDGATKHKPDEIKGGLMERSKTLKVRGKKAKDAIKQRSVSASRALVERSKELSHTLRKPTEETGTKAKRTISPFRFRSSQPNPDRDGSEPPHHPRPDSSPGNNTLSKRERGRSRKKPAVTQLREHWEDTSGKVMARKVQLEDLLEDNQQFESKRREVEAWLCRMENWQARMRPVGHTPDVMEAQVREQKSFHAEVHQYKAHIEEFNHLTQDLISNYQNDDAAKIKKLTEHVNQRYNQLNTSIATRGKLLHSGMTSFQTLNPSFDVFTSWVREMETKLDQTGRDVQRNKNKGDRPDALVMKHFQ